MTRSLTVVVVPGLAEGFARQVSEAVLLGLRAAAWPIAVVPIVAPHIAERPIVVGLPIVADILIAELRSVPLQ
jgi:hypothetical protein